MNDSATFLASVAKVFAKTRSVLEFYKACPEYPKDLNFEPYVGALFCVCREQRKGFGGIPDLQKIHGVFELFRTHNREGRTAEALATALDSIGRYDSWLNETFPEARGGGKSLN